jgi:hypothetical protein
MMQKSPSSVLQIELDTDRLKKQLAGRSTAYELVAPGSRLTLKQRGQIIKVSKINDVSRVLLKLTRHNPYNHP